MRICGVMLALAAAPSAAQVSIMVVEPARPSPPTERWVSGKISRNACIDTATIGGAIVQDPRTVDIIMRGGRRWRMSLATPCSQLSYYGGFYYQPTQPGKFCAGTDRIIGRAGGGCRVAYIAPLRRVRVR